MLLLVLLVTLCTSITTVWAESYRYRFDVVDAAFDRVASQMDSIDHHQHLDERSLPLWQQLDSLAQRHPSAILKARLAYWDVKCHQYTMPSDTAILRLRQVLPLVDSQSYDAARIGYQLAGNLQRNNQLAESWQLLEDTVMPVLKRNEDLFYLGNAYHLYSYIYRDIGDLQEAEHALEEAKRCFQSGNFSLGKVYFAQALMMNHQAQANELYIKSITEDPTDVTIVAQAYTNLAGIALEEHKPDSALAYVERGLLALDTYRPNHDLLRAFLLVNKAELNYALQDYATALELLQEVERLSGENMHLGYSAEIHKYLANTHEKLGNIREAYLYLKSYVDLTNRLQQQRAESQAQRMNDREAIHDRQQEIIDALTAQAERQRMQTWATILILLLIIAGTTFALIHYRKMRHQREAENRELRDVLQQETVGALLTSNIRDDDERSRAEAQLEQVRPGFYARLKEINPDLTDSDLRLCTYISIGMRAKEIAQHLSVTPDSVNTARYRLRKKLNLQQGEKLDDFLRNL